MNISTKIGHNFILTYSKRIAGDEEGPQESSDEYYVFRPWKRVS
jgi:hypothetical protein